MNDGGAAEVSGRTTGASDWGVGQTGWVVCASGVQVCDNGGITLYYEGFGDEPTVHSMAANRSPHLPQYLTPSSLASLNTRRSPQPSTKEKP